MIDWNIFFTLDESTGTLRWKPLPEDWYSSKSLARAINNRRAGRIAGTTSNHGYIRINIRDKSGIQRTGLAHRVIWEMKNGPIPKGKEIDHIDRVKTNNRPENLRLVTREENSLNTRNRNGKVTRGVHWCSTEKRWRVVLRARGIRNYIGCFKDKEDAIKASIQAAKTLHGEFFCMSGPSTTSAAFQ